MINSYQGQGDRILVEIKDGTGVVVPPIDSAGIHDLRIFAVHRTTFEIMEKWSKLPAEGFRQITQVEYPDTGDYKAQCILNSINTEQARQGNYEIQVNIYIPNDDFDGGFQVLVQKGLLTILNPAVNV